MNPISGLVFKWYFFLTILAFSAAITTELTEVLSGIIFAWVIFLIFLISADDKLNFSKNRFSLASLNINQAEKKPPKLMLLSLLSIFASYYSTTFYTGKSFSDIVLAVTLGSSLYNDYQQYFASQGLAAFTIKKIPAVLSMLYIKAVIVFGFISIIVLNKRVTFAQCLWLFIASMSSMYFSIARGTSFELFELLLLLWFCISVRAIRFDSNKTILSKSNFLMLLFGIIALSIYSYNISARYSFGSTAECVSSDICLDPNSVLYSISMPLGELSLKLSAYFTFGIYYTSVLINDYLLDSVSNFFMLLFPFANLIDLDPKFLCDEYIKKCGPTWTPDVAVYIVKGGFLFVFIFVYIIGCFAKKLTVSAFSNSDFIPYCLLYFIFLSLVSLPVGNFLTISSANKMMFTIVLLIFILRKVNIKI